MIFISCLLVNDNSSVVVDTLLLQNGPQQQRQPYQQLASRSYLLSTGVHCVDFHHRTSAWLFVPKHVGVLHNKKQCGTKDCFGLTCSLGSTSDSDNGATDVVIESSSADNNVWYEIAIQGGTSSKSNVEVTSGELVSSILTKIKNSNMNTFKNIDANQFEVYTNKVNKIALDRAEAWSPTTKWGRVKAPLLVKVIQLIITPKGMVLIYLFCDSSCYQLTIIFLYRSLHSGVQYS
jgi:hypothetical protein